MIDFEIANEMRASGATYREIGERFGVTKQRVANFLTSERFANVRKRKHAKLYENIPYVGLSAWINKNEYVTTTGIAKIMFHEANSSTTSKIARLLEGKNVQFTIEQINRLIEATGLPYEELFWKP